MTGASFTTNPAMATSGREQPEPARVGVVIPVYNRRTILLETLPCVLAQTRPPDQLVIVDDGSTDGTPEAAQAWLTHKAPPFPWRVLRQPHQTAAAARALGYRLLSGCQLLAFLDSDDHWPADFLERTTSLLLAHPAAAAVSADRCYHHPTEEITQARDCRGLAEDAIAWLFENGGGIASCTVLRRWAYEAAGGWPVELRTSEDTFLFSMVSLQGPWLHTPGDPVQFHLGSAALQGEDDNLQRSEPHSEFGWARTYEKIYQIVKPHRPADSFDVLHARLALRWNQAGKQLFRLGRLRAASACHRRSLTWRRMQLRAWRRLVRVQLAKLFGQPPATVLRTKAKPRLKSRQLATAGQTSAGWSL